MVNFADDEAFDNALHGARLNLIEAIGEAAKDQSSSTALAQLAEAYAWVVSPAQHHGGTAQH